MTVNTLSSIAEFETNGVTTNFPFYFKFLASDDLVVTYVSPTGVTSVLTLGSQYTVNGAGNDNGGSVVTTSALAGPGQLVVSREMEAFQQTALRNQGKFLAETHEDVFDKLTMLIQQGFSLLYRALLRPFGKNYYDAESRNISNLADPVADQDAATKGWSGRYFGDLIDGATGLINTTTGILYDSGTLFDYLRFGVGRNVDSISALRLLSGARNRRAFVLGYYAPTDGGGGAYWFDPADTSSADNGGSIIVADDGGRWKLAQSTPWSIRQFGAKGDGVTDDSSAILRAFNALSSTGRLIAPKGIYAHKLVLFDGAIGFRLEGDASLGATIFRNISTVVTDGVKLRSTFNCTVKNIHFDHSSASFTGYLVECNHKPGGGNDTQCLVFDECTFASKGYNLYTAKGVNLDKATIVSFKNCKVGSLLRPFDGQSSAGGSYSNVICFENLQVFDNVGYTFNYPGEQWIIRGGNQQACHDGAQRVAYSDGSCVWSGLHFEGFSLYDATAVGPAYILLNEGGNLSIDGGLWGGRSDIGSSALFSASGPVSGVNFKGAKFSLFTNLVVANTPGSSGWDISGGNRFIGITNYIINPENVDGLSFDLNAPNVSRGTRPGTSGGSSIRYNQDGSVEMTGAVGSVPAGSDVPVPFPTVFPVACWDVQLTLQAPASPGNVVSLSGVPANTGFTVRIAGSGNSTVRWRAVGK